MFYVHKFGSERFMKLITLSLINRVKSFLSRYIVLLSIGSLR